MLSEQVRQALVDLVHNAALAEQFVGDLDAEAFAADLKTFYATTRRLEIISEAVRRAGPDLRSRHPHLPWRQMMSAGNIYRHEYDNVAPAFVWKTVCGGLPELVAAVQRELATSQ
jgi:uncharacterized protein with HEPN domain